MVTFLLREGYNVSAHMIFIDLWFDHILFMKYSIDIK